MDLELRARIKKRIEHSTYECKNNVFHVKGYPIDDLECFIDGIMSVITCDCCTSKAEYFYCETHLNELDEKARREGA